jgi:hypothetical protein
MKFLLNLHSKHVVQCASGDALTMTHPNIRWTKNNSILWLLKEYFVCCFLLTMYVWILEFSTQLIGWFFDSYHNIVVDDGNIL